jgi:hypothetical protein
MLVDELDTAIWELAGWDMPGRARACYTGRVHRTRREGHRTAERRASN